MKRFAADLHIHTALSPCALDEMTPCAIVQTAMKRGMDMIAVCDHNSATNAAAVMEAAVRLSDSRTLFVLAGIEITTIEEVHLVGLFPDAVTAECVGEVVRETLPVIKSETNVLGNSLRMDAHDEISGRETRMLPMASCLNLEETVQLIHQNKGMAIPAHVDRPCFSVTSQLGNVPEGMAFDALEISAIGCQNGRVPLFSSHGFPMITSSDSHSLEEIGTVRTWLWLEEGSFGELVMAFHGQCGRRVDGLGGEEGEFRG